MLHRPTPELKQKEGQRKGPQKLRQKGECNGKDPKKLKQEEKYAERKDHKGLLVLQLLHECSVTQA